MSDLVENPKNQFSRIAAHMLLGESDSLMFNYYMGECSIYSIPVYLFRPFTSTLCHNTV